MDKKRLKKITLLHNKGYFHKYTDKKDKKNPILLTKQKLFS